VQLFDGSTSAMGLSNRKDELGSYLGVARFVNTG